MPTTADAGGREPVPRSAQPSPASPTCSCHQLTCWRPHTAPPYHVHLMGEPGQAQGSRKAISKGPPGCCTQACTLASLWTSPASPQL